MPALITTENRQQLGEMREAAQDEVMETRRSAINVENEILRVAGELEAACRAFYDFDSTLSTKLANVVAVNSDVKCITYSLMCERAELADQMITCLRSWLQINILNLNTVKKISSAHLDLTRIENAIMIREPKRVRRWQRPDREWRGRRGLQVLADYIEHYQLWVNNARTILRRALACYSVTCHSLFFDIQHVVAWARGGGGVYLDQVDPLFR